MTAITTTLFLPSKGQFYEGRIPEGKVQARPMVMQDIASLESAGGSDKMDKLLRSCTFLPNGVDHGELLMTDRMALLFSLRVLSLESVYKYEYVCKYCKALNRISCNLATDLVEKPLDPDLVEPIKITLPNGGDTLELRFLRGKDEEAVTKYAKRMRLSSNDQEDPSAPYRVAKQIVTVNGEKRPIVELERYVKELPLRSVNAIADLMDKVEPGIDTTITPDCVKCSAMNKIQLELTSEFFRPTNN